MFEVNLQARNDCEILMRVVLQRPPYVKSRLAHASRVSPNMTSGRILLLDTCILA